MRFIGLTLCLLASTFGARADSLEDRVTALELRVKVLEDALHAPVAPITAQTLDGSYKAVLPNGDVITAVFDNGKVVANDGKGTKSGTYEIVGQKVVVTADGKTESLTIDGNHLRTDDTNRIEFTRTAPGNATPVPTPALDGSYQATMPNGKMVNLELANGKATASVENDSKSGTYEVVGGEVVITIDGKAKTFTVEGDHLKSLEKDEEKFDFRKTK